MPTRASWVPPISTYKETIRREVKPAQVTGLVTGPCPRSSRQLSDSTFCPRFPFARVTGGLHAEKGSRPPRREAPPLTTSPSLPTRGSAPRHQPLPPRARLRPSPPAAPERAPTGSPRARQVPGWRRGPRQGRFTESTSPAARPQAVLCLDDIIPETRARRGNAKRRVPSRNAESVVPKAR